MPRPEHGPPRPGLRPPGLSNAEYREVRELLRRRKAEDRRKTQTHLGFRGWTPADMRILWITIIAGLVVNIITILFVGLALAFVRVLSRSNHVSGGHPATLVKATTLILVVTGVQLGLALLMIWARLKRKDKLMIAIVVLVMGSILGLLLMVLVGYAAGVK